MAPNRMCVIRIVIRSVTDSLQRWLAVTQDSALTSLPVTTTPDRVKSVSRGFSLVG